VGWGAFAVAVAALVVVLLRARRTAAGLERRLETASRGLETLQQSFARFAPPEVVDEIARGAAAAPERREITVLFADVKGFTQLAEGLEPTVLVALLNGYLERMSQAITAHRGHVAKFMGDGLMALFGALDANPWHSDDAARAALAMRAALVEYNATTARSGLPPIAIGVGIHRGPVIAGVMGSRELMEYGVIGNTVNVASRVERLTRVHGVDILVSESARAALDRRFILRPMPAVEVRGVTGLLATFAVEGFDGASA